MDEKIVDIKGLSNEDLLTLHAKIEEHLKYLDDSVISLEEANETNGTSEDSEASTEADGGEENE